MPGGAGFAAVRGCLVVTTWRGLLVDQLVGAGLKPGGGGELLEGGRGAVDADGVAGLGLELFEQGAQRVGWLAAGGALGPGLALGLG